MKCFPSGSTTCRCRTRRCALAQRKARNRESASGRRRVSGTARTSRARPFGCFVPWRSAGNDPVGAASSACRFLSATSQSAHRTVRPGSGNNYKARACVGSNMLGRVVADQRGVDRFDRTSTAAGKRRSFASFSGFPAHQMHDRDQRGGDGLPAYDAAPNSTIPKKSPTIGGAFNNWGLEPFGLNNL